MGVNQRVGETRGLFEGCGEEGLWSGNGAFLE